MIGVLYRLYRHKLSDFATVEDCCIGSTDDIVYSEKCKSAFICPTSPKSVS